MHRSLALLQSLFLTSFASDTYYFGTYSNYYEDGIATHPNLDKNDGCCGFSGPHVDCSVGCQGATAECGPKDPDAIGNLNRCGIGWTDDCGRQVTVGDGSGTDCNWYVDVGTQVAPIINQADKSTVGTCNSLQNEDKCFTWGSQLYSVDLECITDACVPDGAVASVVLSVASQAASMASSAEAASSTSSPTPTSSPAWQGNYTAPKLRKPRNLSPTTLVPRLRPN